MPVIRVVQHLPSGLSIEQSATAQAALQFFNSKDFLKTPMYILYINTIRNTQLRRHSLLQQKKKSTQHLIPHIFTK